ncbi:MAG: hypothetical protein ACJ79S_04155 [Gemmatimonadaceae bacterium]
MTRRWLLLPLVSIAALALGACSSETAVSPLAPSAPSMARRATALPFHGTLDAVETGQFQPATNRVLVHLEGTGTATHLGRYTLVADFIVNPVAHTVVGTLVLTAADGATLTATATGQATPLPNGIRAAVETATITGGTGRLAGATGSFVIERTLTLATGVSSGSFDGVINLGK